jgi:hypothetical protein
MTKLSANEERELMRGIEQSAEGHGCTGAQGNQEAGRYLERYCRPYGGRLI